MKNHKARRLARYGSDSRGSVLVLVAILLVVFLGVAALAIDIGHLSTTKNELQNVADAAALAGAGYLGSEYLKLPPSAHPSKTFTRAEIASVVQAVAQQNKAAGINISIDTTNTDDLKVGLWNPATKQVDANGTDPLVGPYTSPDAVQVVARRDDAINSPVSTFFAKIFGVDTMAVSAEAVAALSGPSTVAEGDLITPFGISERAFPTDCQDVINFSPTPSSCAGWHNFFDPKDANALGGKMYGLILNDTCKYCTGTQLNGAAWMAANFNINTNIDPANKLKIPTPETSTGDDFDFIGGDAATLFNGEYLNPAEYDGNTGKAYKNGVYVTPTDAKNPAPFTALFDYFRYRDGDSDLYKLDANGEPVLDASGNPILIAHKDDVWSATVPVYKDDPNVDCESTGSNPVNDIEIVGFAKISVLRPNPPPSTNIDVIIDCRFDVIKARGGGGSYGNIKGSVPNLVK